jgi:Protein of unknown function (DUF2911)
MKKIIFCLVVVFISVSMYAQTTTLPPVDKSPMDMSYFPNNYPVLKIQDKLTEPLVGRVIYSRPQRSGRTIFGGLVKYGEVWRFGANEATEIEFYKNVKLGGKKIKAGRYTLYAIANETTWTIIVNKETDTWGSFKYDAKKDLVRTEIPVQKTETPVESLTMVFEKTVLGMNLIVAWDVVKVSIPFNF